MFLGQVRSLVGELGCHMLLGVAKKKKKIKSLITRISDLLASPTQLRDVVGM